MKDAGWIQTPMFAPPITWAAPSVASLPSWSDHRRVCVDVETRDDDLTKLGPGVRRGGYMCGIGFAIEDGPAHYLPVRHEGGGNLDPAQVLAYLRDQARDFTGTIVLAGGQYDLDYLWEAGVAFDRAAWHRDPIAVAEPLLDELQDHYNLDAVLGRRGLPLKDEGELEAHARAWGVHKKKSLWRLHAGAVGRYVERDVRAPLELLRRQEVEIEDQGLQQVYDLESRVLPAMLRMTRRGIPVDLDELDRMSAWAKSVVAEELAKIKHWTGVEVVSPANAAQVAAALAQRGITTPKNVHPTTQKVSPSVTKDWLVTVDDDVARSVIRARVFAKLDGTYCGGLRKHVVGDMVYPSFKALHSASDDEDEDDEGARFGRMAARHPNVQAQMKRNKEIKTKWRRVFRATLGRRWTKADYSQQEPRTTVHFAELLGLPGAAEAAQQYRDNPMQDSYDLLVNLSGLVRDDVKEIFLGRSYGMGGGRMARKLKLPFFVKVDERSGQLREYAGPEAQAVIDKFDAAVPFIRKLAQRTMDVAKSRGYLLTLLKRRCRFPKDAHGNYDWTYKAMNRLIQGSAADQTKMAFVAIDAAGLDPILAVHDEFDFQMDDPRRMREVVEIMRSALPLRVPSRVDVEVGTSYGDTEKWDPFQEAA